MGMISLPEWEHLRFDLDTLTDSEWLIGSLWLLFWEPDEDASGKSPVNLVFWQE